MVASRPAGAAIPEMELPERGAALQRGASDLRPQARNTSVLSSLSSMLAPLATPVRHLVSKKKRRFQQDGFDLDLSYITPRIIAMGYPSTAIEAAYRNPAVQVKAFLARYHPVSYTHLTLPTICSV